VLTVRAFFDGEVKVFGGEQYRPLLHVYDAAQVVVDQLTSSETGTFNLKNQNIRIIDLAHQLEEHFSDLKIETTPMQFQDARNYQASSKRAEQILGFNPQRSVHDGIEEVRQLLDHGRLKNVDNPRYSNQDFLSKFNTHQLMPEKGTL
jgi:nucleoside-diphosphate-sugar epimerase